MKDKQIPSSSQSSLHLKVDETAQSSSVNQEINKSSVEATSGGVANDDNPAAFGHPSNDDPNQKLESKKEIKKEETRYGKKGEIKVPKLPPPPPRFTLRGGPPGYSGPLADEIPKYNNYARIPLLDEDLIGERGRYLLPDYGGSRRLAPYQNGNNHWGFPISTNPLQMEATLIHQLRKQTSPNVDTPASGLLSTHHPSQQKMIFEKYTTIAEMELQNSVKKLEGKKIKMEELVEKMKTEVFQLRIQLMNASRNVTHLLITLAFSWLLFAAMVVLYLK